MRSYKWTAALMVFLGAGNASASTEINGLFDARSAGMGGTGVAFLDSAGAIPTNPALLDQVRKLTLTLDLFYIAARPEAPYTINHLDPSGRRYQTYDTIRSPATGALLPFLGGAFRLHERIVVGAAVYPIIGQGTSAKYYPAPEERPALRVHNDASLGFIEGGVPISVRILDNLSFGAMWRMTYMIQSVSTTIPAGPPAGVLLDSSGNPVYADIDVTGFDAAGFQLGLFYKPLRNLGLGFSYRSKVVVDGEGKTKTRNPLSGAPLELDTRTSFTYPHAFRAGAAVALLDDQLLLAGDFKYLMYAEAFKTLTTTTVRDGVPSDEVRPLYWRDAWNVQLGAEYKIGITRVRAGYIRATSATNPAYAVQLMAPPGVSHLGSVGFGIAISEHLNVDLAAAYVVLQHRIDTPTADNSGIGTYASRAGEFSLSCTFHM
jgi:long-chain fatty acid transport protein